MDVKDIQITQRDLDKVQAEVNLNGVVFPELPFKLLDHAILIGNRGSHSHGTYISNSDPNSIDDIDLMAVVIAPIENYWGLKVWEHAEAINDPWDVVVYEFRKFMGMLMKHNPNVMMMLWLEPEDYYHIDYLGEVLIDNRDLFSSREAFDSFLGYAKAQLARMTHIAGRGYLGAKRKALVEKYGYDTKNAAHVIRLLHMGIEFMETGCLNVKRTWDRQQLIDIKTGKVDLVTVNKIAAEAFDKIAEVEQRSSLPKRVDEKKIQELCVAIMQDWFSRRNTELSNFVPEGPVIK